MTQTYGYVRISTREQNEGRHLVAMQNLGYETVMFLDELSRKYFE